MSEPQTATPDQLATLYLRARDVPCPDCGYNRRDGITHNCPECDAPLDLIPDKRDPSPIPPKLTLASAIGTLILSVPWLVLSIRLTEWIEMLKTIARALGAKQLSYQILDLFDYLQIVEVAGIAAATWFSAASIWVFRRNKTSAARKAALAILALTIGLQPFAWWNIYSAFFR